MIKIFMMSLKRHVYLVLSLLMRVLIKFNYHPNKKLRKWIKFMKLILIMQKLEVQRFSSHWKEAVKIYTNNSILRILDLTEQIVVKNKIWISKFKGALKSFITFKKEQYQILKAKLPYKSTVIVTIQTFKVRLHC